MSSGDGTKLGRHAGALVSLLRSAAGSSLSLVRTSRAASVCLAKGKTFKKRLTTAMFFRNLRNIRKDHGINIIAYFFSKIRRTSFFNKEHKKECFPLASMSKSNHGWKHFRSCTDGHVSLRQYKQSNMESLHKCNRLLMVLPTCE